MVLKVAEMGTKLEIVAPAVWDYPAVDDMNLANTPTVESCFVEEVIEDIVRTYLDVAGACTKATDGQSSRYGSSIGSMGEPQNGGRAVLVRPGNHTCFQPLKYSRIVVRQGDRSSKGSHDRRVIPIEPNVEGQVIRVAGKEIPDLVRERKGWRQRDGANFANVAPYDVPVENSRSGMSGYPVYGYLEESIRPVIVREGLNGCASFDHGLGIDMGGIEFTQCTTTPGHPGHGFRGMCARREVNIFGEGEGRQSSDTT